MHGPERLFLDTAFIQALLNKRDKYYEEALSLSPRLRTAKEVWITEAVFLELGAALSSINRSGAAQFIRQAYSTPNMRIVSVDTALLARALTLYDSRSDKEWSLTDCISFIVMQDEGLQVALSSDNHFQQAGFQALMNRTP